MDPKENTRNADQIAGVLVDELMKNYAVMMETNGEEVVMELFKEKEPLQRVAKRLELRFPPPARLAALLLERRYYCT